MKQGGVDGHKEAQLQRQLIILNPSNFKALVARIHDNTHPFKLLDDFSVTIGLVKINLFNVSLKCGYFRAAPLGTCLVAVILYIAIDLLNIVAHVFYCLRKRVCAGEEGVCHANVRERRRQVKQSSTDWGHIHLLEHGVENFELFTMLLILLAHWEGLLLIGKEDSAHLLF